MEATLYFYTGTGNSLWTAKQIAGHLEHTRLQALTGCRQETVRCDTPCIGLVFPVHIWGVPPPVVNFIERLQIDPDRYLFAVAVHAGQVAATLLQLEKLLQQKQICLSSGFSIDLPSNYIPWGGAISPARQQKKFAAAVDKFERIAAVVRRCEKRPPESGPIWQNWFFSILYRKSLPYVATMDKSFFADEKCSSCGICEKICPACNIRINSGKPVWQHRCEQCFACIQWCPEEAIQYGRGTTGKKRYRHPEISLADMLSSVSGKEGREE